MKESLREALCRLKAGLAAGEYDRARAALEELIEAARSLAQAGQLDEDLVCEVGAELERGRRVVLAARAHDAARLARLRRLPADYAEGGGPGGALRLDA